MRKTVRERFYENFKVDERGCWIWNGTIGTGGYGEMYANGRIVRAHRLSLDLHQGPLSPSLCALHKCDVPPCVNPDHLSAGTHFDNMADMRAKGRQNYMKGERCGAAKLTAAQVIEIRGSELSCRGAAKAYGISKSNVSKIRTKGSWKHV